MENRSLVDAFVEYLRDHGHPGLQVVRRPDEENRDTADIDAIAGPLAIEHTSIDTLPDQRRDNDWFARVVDGLEEELSPHMTFRLRIALEWKAVARGQNWSGIRQALKNWTLTYAERVPDGLSVRDGIAGVPFPIHLWKQSDRPPGLFFGRLKPDDETLSERIREQLNKKARKLASYHSRGKTTVLLVESPDWVLMNESKMLKGIREAFPAGLPPGVDQIWYADSFPNSSVHFWDFTEQLAASLDP